MNLFGELFDDIFGAFRIVIEIRFQEIGKKKHSQDGKHNEQFDTDDNPQRFSDGHTAKTVYIKFQYFVYQTQNHVFKFRDKNTKKNDRYNIKKIFFGLESKFLIIFALNCFTNFTPMKNRFPRFSRIVLKDWLEYHPYKKEVSSDHFYIDLCNDLQHEMLHCDVDDHLVGADYKFLSCMLACYFEDVVSRAGIWTSFVDEHHKLYGKYLPFYDMSGYERGELNLADVQFLIWHFSSNLSIHSHFVDPFLIEKAEIAHVAYTLLNEMLGQAPINEDLKIALTLPSDANIHTVVERLDFFFLGCYIHHYYTTTLMEEEILDVKNQKGTQKDIDNRRASLLFNRVSPLLAQHAGEILAHWAGETHPLYKNLTSLSKRKEGLFLFEDITTKHLQMKHIASGKIVNLHIPDWDFPLVAGETVVRTGIVQWGNEWYAIGPAYPAINEKIATNEKFLFASFASHLGIIKREEECFLEVTGKKRIVIIENKRELFTFIDNVWETYHLKYGMESMDRKLFDVHSVTFEVDEDLENVVIFFNPRTGMEFYPEIAQYISIEDNPYFDKTANTNIEELILNERVSSDFVRFLIENEMIEIEPISGKQGFNFVLTDCDFLLRYWKKERYVAEPKLFVE